MCQETCFYCQTGNSSRDAILIREFEEGVAFTMLYPSIDRLMELVDSKYSLVVATSKRARKLQERSLASPGSSTTKNVSRALWEIFDGSVKYFRTRDGIK